MDQGSRKLEVVCFIYSLLTVVIIHSNLFNVLGKNTYVYLIIGKLKVFAIKSVYRGVVPFLGDGTQYTVFI